MSGYMTHNTLWVPEIVAWQSRCTSALWLGGLLIVSAAYLGANPNNKNTQPTISSSAHTGTGAETTGSGNSFR